MFHVCEYTNDGSTTKQLVKIHDFENFCNRHILLLLFPGIHATFLSSNELMELFLFFEFHDKCFDVTLNGFCDGFVKICFTLSNSISCICAYSTHDHYGRLIFWRYFMKIAVLISSRRKDYKWNFFFRFIRK